MYSNQRLTQLYRLSLTLGTTLDLARETATFMDWLEEAVHPRMALLFVTDPAEQEMQLAQARGLPLPDDLCIPAGSDPWDQLTGQGIALPNGRSLARHTVPITAGEQELGVLCLADEPARKRDPEGQAFLEEATQHLASALRRIRHHQALARRTAERTAALAALDAITAMVNQSLTLEETIAKALEAVLDAIQFEMGGIGLWDKATQQLHPVMAKGVEAKLQALFSGTPRAGGLREQVLRSGRPLFIDDTAHHRGVNPDIARYGFTASAIMPLISKGETLGLLAVATRAQRQWAAEDRSLLTAVCQYIAMTIATARLYEEARQLATFNETIVNNMTEGILVEDADGNITFVNAAMARLSGYTPEELLGRPRALIASDEQQIEAVRAGATDRYEAALLTKDGREVPVIVSAQPLFDETGHLARVLSVFTDISERKQAEEALQERERFLASVFASIQNGISILDNEMNVLRVNPTMERWYAHAMPIVGRKCYEAYHGRSSPCEGCVPLKTLETGKAMHEIVPKRGPGGKHVGWLEVYCFPLEDITTGQLKGAIEYVQDITEHKQAEEALAQERQLLRTLIDNIPDHIYVKDREGRFLVANLATARVMGAKSPDELLGKTDFDFYPRDLADRYFADEQEILRSGQPMVNREEPLMDQGTGEQGWLLTTKVPFRDAHGEIAGIIGISRNITERKRAEAEIRRRAAQQEALNAIIAAAAGASDLSALLETTLSHTLQALGLHMGSIWVDDLRVIHGLPAEIGPVMDTMAQAIGLEALNSCAVEDWQSITQGSQSAIVSAMIRHGVRASITVPIQANERCIGGLNVSSPEPRPWTQEEIALIEAVGRQMGTAAERLRLLEETNRRLQEVTLLSRVIAATASAEDLPVALQEICEELAHFLQLPQVAFALLDEERTEARIIAEYREPGRPQTLGTVISVHTTPSMAYVLNHKAPLAITEAEGNPLLAPIQEIMRKQGSVSFLVVPILVRGQVVGMLGLDSPQRREFSQAEITLVNRVAEQVGQTLERVKLLQQLRTRAEVMSRLALLGDTLNYPHGLDEVISAIGHGASTLSGADRVAIYIRHPDDTVSCPWFRGLSPGYVKRATSLVRKLHGGRLLEIPKPILISDIEKLPQDSLTRTLAQTEGFRAVAVWPLVYEGRTVAAAGCYYDKPHTWSEAEREALEAFARQAAVALENARLYASLQKTNAQLQEALHAKDEMIQNVSHELRTPLTLIRGCAEMLKTGTLGPLTTQQTEVVETLYDNCERLHHMVQRLLTLQALAPDTLQKTRMDPVSWLKSVQTNWQHRAKEAGLHLHVEIAPDVPTIEGDLELLNQVIDNLLDNATKFSPSGGEIRLRAWREGQDFMLSIADQGVGIPPDQLDKVFERFHQVEGDTTRRFGGMGIGLALCKQIVEGHGGRIWVESEGEGRGSTFYIALPAAQVI